MIRVSVSQELNSLLDEAAALSARRRQHYVGVEHLFEALLEKGALLPGDFLAKHRGFLNQVLSDLLQHPWPGTVPAPLSELFFTPRAARAATVAGKLAESMGVSGASAGHLLLALLADAHALPSRVVDVLHLPRGEMIEDLRAALLEQPGGASPQGPVSGSHPAQPLQDESIPSGQRVSVVLAALTRDLTAEAREGRLEPVIGREQELFDLLQILARKTKNNAILVGEPGVGKTKLAEGLAIETAAGKLDDVLFGYRVLELNIGGLLAGTQYRGAFEERLHDVLQELAKLQDVILFIDEIHLIMGAGSTDDNPIDMANLLKPALARGDLRCVGATTFEEYRRFIARDPALERRFQMLRIEPLSEEATCAVLLSLRPSLERHHEVKISRRAIRAAVRLSQRYIPDRQLPDKAIDALDQACARFRLKAVALRQRAKSQGLPPPEITDKVTPHEVRKVISRISAVPIEEITAEERRQLGNLERDLKRRIIGQDPAIRKIVATVKKSRAGLSNPQRPDAVMLFLGPTGVGKTEMAKALAELLFGSSSHLITFDMSEYTEEHSVAKLLGAPPGYVGSEQEGRLTAAVRNKPFSLLLFDEIEKAHPRVFDVLLPVLDEGRLRAGQRGEVSFKHCIIVMTSNAGADVLEAPEAGTDSQALLNALRLQFRPEFINRIDEIVPFYPLLFEDVREILHLSMRLLRTQLRDQQLRLHVYQGAYEYLARHGHSVEFGARELQRTFDRLLVNRLSELILQGRFQPGDIIDVLVENDELVIRKGKWSAPTKVYPR